MMANCCSKPLCVGTIRRRCLLQSRMTPGAIAICFWHARIAASRNLAARGESRFLMIYTGAVTFSLKLPALVIQCGHGHGQLHAEETAGSDLDCAPHAGARS